MNHPLLLEIQLFAAGKSGFTRDEPPEGRKIFGNVCDFFNNIFYSSDFNSCEKEFKTTRGTSSNQRHSI